MAMMAMPPGAAPGAASQNLSGQVEIPGYTWATTAAVSIGAGGLPRAKPYLGRVENEIRHPYCAIIPGCECCCVQTWEAGPNIPEHWLDARLGWVTRYFTDIEPFSWQQKKSGRFACQVVSPTGQRCNHTVDGGSCCKDSCCWCPTLDHVGQMSAHLTTTHGINNVPRKYEWASGCCDTQGCLDVILCGFCNGSRQFKAVEGWGNTFSIWRALEIFCWACDSVEVPCSKRRLYYYLPPYWYIALQTRFNLIVLNDIDEGCCTTWCMICCFPWCSVAQTYRELSASGVWPGGVLNPTPPTTVLQQRVALVHAFVPQGVPMGVPMAANPIQPQNKQMV